MSPGLVGHHVALLWCSVTLGVHRDDESGRQRLARGEPFALGVVQTASARWIGSSQVDFANFPEKHLKYIDHHRSS